MDCLEQQLSTASLVKEAQDLSSSLFASRLLVCHDTISGRDEDVSELTRRQQVHHPLLDLTDFDVESGRDDTALVDASGQFNHDLAGSVVINDLEFTNVSCETQFGEKTW